jgi:hypothetical protein
VNPSDRKDDAIVDNFDGGNADKNDNLQADGDDKDRHVSVLDGDQIPQDQSPKRKKKIKPVKTKTVVTYNKDLIPESVITIRRCKNKLK